MPTPERVSSAIASDGAAGVRAGAGERRRVGLEVDAAELADEHPLGLRPLLGIEQADVQHAGPDRRLELARRPLGDHLSVVDHGDPLGELVGLVEVLGAEQHRRPLGGQRADDVPDQVAGARVEARSSARRGTSAPG